jgi:hypothetical protein
MSSVRISNLKRKKKTIRGFGIPPVTEIVLLGIGAEDVISNQVDEDYCSGSE